MEAGDRTGGHMRRRIACGIILAGLISSALVGPASAGLAPPHSPASTLQVWNVSMNQLQRSGWNGFITRMAVSEFAPDIITAQDLGNGLDVTFLNAVKATFGPHYEREPAADGNTIIWNTDRLSRINGTTFPHQTNGCGNGSYAPVVNLRDMAASALYGETRNVAVTSVHYVPSSMTTECTNHSLFNTNAKLDAVAPVRRMTILAGDFNQRPDKRAEEAVNGLEADPECWYRRASAAHATNIVTQEGCGSPAHDRYYDTVWLYPGSGGGTNPTATSFCEQYTYDNVLAPLSADLDQATNSCTDLVENGSGDPSLEGNGLDKARIDYIWTSYERADGLVWNVPAPTVAAFVQYASADLGMSFSADSAGTRYSDHRATEAVLTWPSAMP